VLQSVKFKQSFKPPPKL